MIRINGFIASLFSFLSLGLLLSSAHAKAPQPWEINFQPAATGIMEEVALFHDFLLMVIGLISAFVLLLILYCIFRFNEDVNPEASRISHNVSLEIIWTIVPVLILAIIVAPSLSLLDKQVRIPKADMVVKIIGHQWYWEYEYNDDKLSFSSVLIEEGKLKKNQLRLLSVDNPFVVPVNKTVRLMITASDVVHSFSVPAFGIKMDAVPGRLNETWFRATRAGTYYGQCSELCGRRHAFMPIEVRVVSDREYKRWLRGAKREFSTQEQKHYVAHE